MNGKQNDDLMDDGKASGVLGSALLVSLLEKAGDRWEKAVAIGFIHTAISPENKTETYLIRFEKDESFSIETIDPKQYRDGALIYFYDNEEDAIVQSTLREEPLINFDEI